ncbi:DUF3226 domain-containing protein [Undibacterium sp. WLX3042]|uniref:DUF3226 domain-containing protein n=1 Tax=Undibacterium sp. WLX3042 TaxID=3412686 RepID=UPI003C2B48ED
MSNSTKAIFFKEGQEFNRQRETCPYVIFVEGTDDAHFVDTLLSDIGASTDVVGIVIVGGKGNFPSFINSFCKQSNFTQGTTKGIAIIRDADEDHLAATKEVQEIFQKISSIQINNASPIRDGNYRFGFYLLPKENENGDLEKLCLETVKDEPIEVLAEKFIQEIQSLNQTDQLNQINKRKTQTYLSGVIGEICKGPGLGIKRGHFKLDHQALSPLKQFLKDFIPSTQ